MAGGSLPNGKKRYLHQLQHRVEEFSWEQLDDATISVTLRTCIAPPVWEAAFDCTYRYTIGSSYLALEVAGTPRGDWPQQLPRIGLELTLPGALDRVSWLGLGPGESYADSKQAARFGSWHAGVDELLTPYVRPQENGNRCGYALGSACAAPMEPGCSLLGDPDARLQRAALHD